MTKIISVEQFILDWTDSQTGEFFRELADRTLGGPPLVFASAEAAEAAVREVLTARADGQHSGLCNSRQEVDAAIEALRGCERRVRETRRSGPPTIEREDRGDGFDMTLTVPLEIRMTGVRYETKSVIVDGETYTRKVKVRVESPWIAVEPFHTTVEVNRKVLRLIDL